MGGAERRGEKGYDDRAMEDESEAGIKDVLESEDALKGRKLIIRFFRASGQRL